MLASGSEVRFCAHTGQHLLGLSLTGFDRPCVKTHASAKWKKYNSPARRCAARPQHDLTLTTRNSSEIFYARGRRSSFHTAKTHLCHSMSNLAALHGSVLGQRYGNVRLPA